MNALKKSLIKIYSWPMLPKEKVEHYQERIRQAEWEAVKSFIKTHSKFLDVGCGMGWSMMRAKVELHCEVRGIDPQKERYDKERKHKWPELSLLIDEGVSEKLPYQDEAFDVVFSSHMLEHANDAKHALKEMKRVLKRDGIVIVGMPTATMAYIGMISQMVFTTHMRWYEFFSGNGSSKWKFLFFPPSHSENDKTILYDVKAYKVKRWSELIGSQFRIQHTLFPAVYPYPDLRQWFSLFKSKRRGSSVFFICSKP